MRRCVRLLAGTGTQKGLSEQMLRRHPGMQGLGMMEGGGTWPEHLGSCELLGRSAVPMTSSGLQTARWPERAWGHLCALGSSRGLQGLLRLRVQ